MAGGPFLRPSTISITGSKRDQNRDETSEQRLRYSAHSHSTVYAVDCSDFFIFRDTNEGKHNDNPGSRKASLCLSNST
jgi:hypothetical protein